MSLDEKSALRRLNAQPVARLATTTPSGNPHIVPVTFASDGTFLFTMVDHKPKKTMALQRLTNIAANPSVSVLTDEYDNDWTQLWWVRIDGQAAVVESGSNWALAQRLLVQKYPQYRNDPPLGPAIVTSIDNVTWWQWSP